jgi:pyridoxine/pyridoxamine 5'-phosphate oxidase
VSAAPEADDLSAILGDIWDRLSRGVADRRSAFHSPTLATLGLDGGTRARTVVLREADRGERRLRFHCDRRSDKFAELAAEPRLTLHIYDASAQIQVRAEGVATLHTVDTVAGGAWESSRPASRVCYATEPAPGAILDRGGAFSLPADEAAIAAGRANFAAVIVTVRTLEYLNLAFAGHRRARFAFDGGEWEARWLVP